MDEWDKILSDVALEETKDEFQDEWYCSACEHGPMVEKDDKCTRCGEKNSQYGHDELDGFEDADEMEGIEEINYDY
jgi:uncharacterized paraquat-inducible protein A